MTHLQQVLQKLAQHLDSIPWVSGQADYLRRLGALDDSDPQQPQVIMANYMMAQSLGSQASDPKLS